MLSGDSTERSWCFRNISWFRNGKSEIDVWYFDGSFKDFGNLLWKDYNPSLYSKPPAPKYLASGELNTYGYNFIYLPGMKETFIPEYINWVETYLASLGNSEAGVGTLVDEGQNGGGGW